MTKPLTQPAARPSRPIGAKEPLRADQKKTNAQRHQELDELCKQAMETDKARLLELVLTRAVRKRLRLPAAPVELLEVLPTEMRRKRVYTDYLIRVRIGAKVVLLHVEFQNRADPKMAVRIPQYQVAAVARHGLPVYSVVFNVHGGGAHPIQMQGEDWGMLLTGWVEVTVSRAMRGWSQGSSPLAVVLATLLGELTDEDLNQCLVQLRALGIDDETCRDLVDAVCFLADVKRKGSWDETRKRLFMRLRINQTWLFKEGHQEGLEEGIEQERTESLKAVVAVCQQRFGAPPDERTLERIRKIREPGFLSRLLVQLTQATSLPEALSILPAR